MRARITFQLLCVFKNIHGHRGSNVGHDCTTKDLPETSFCATCLPFDSSFIVPMQHQVCLLSPLGERFFREGPKIFEKVPSNQLNCNLGKFVCCSIEQQSKMAI